MSRPAPPKPPADASAMRAEFDRLADDYYAQHKDNIAISGEAPEFFAEYKIADLHRQASRIGLQARHVLDFGSGIGNSVPHFRRHFPESALACVDVSLRSMEIARTRSPGTECYVHIEDGRLPLADASQDIVFTACVFHHIPHREHAHWLAELRRVTRAGGLLALFEHNPLNPLTVHAVNTCPLDANARLIRAGRMRRRIIAAGWTDARIGYRLFFPGSLARLRPLERALAWLPLGAQYCVYARRPG